MVTASAPTTVARRLVWEIIDCPFVVGCSWLAVCGFLFAVLGARTRPSRASGSRAFRCVSSGLQIVSVFLEAAGEGPFQRTSQERRRDRTGAPPQRSRWRQTACLFSRAAARDFIDVAALLRRFTKPELCTIAAAKDRGFNIDVLADAFSVLPTYDRDDEYPTLNDDDYRALTAVFAQWQREIRQQ